MSRSAFPDPRRFAFVPALEREADGIRAELDALGAGAFAESPDSLGERPGGYVEPGLLWYPLLGAGACPENAALCPRTAAACRAVPGVVNAGFSLLRPGTHLEPHRGELAGVLRCHLPLVVPDGDLGLSAGGETRAWRAGECLVFDDTREHEAWNRGAGDRVVLLVTFRAEPGPATSASAGTLEQQDGGAA